MQAFRLLVILLVCGSPLAAQTSAQHGIQNGDLDKTCDPCTDFAQYANGTWHAQNPIPPYMDRWSRRWQAGEQAKDQLRVILDEVSSRTDWAKGSVEQLIGDYYSSCIDEPRINKLGLAPAEPMLKQIREMKSVVDLQRMIQSLHEQPSLSRLGSPRSQTFTTQRRRSPMYLPADWVCRIAIIT